MNIKQIRELAQIAAENGLSAIEIAEGENRVRIERTAATPAAIPTVLHAVRRACGRVRGSRARSGGGDECGLQPYA